MNKLLSTFIFISIFIFSHAQPDSKPKLVVGIVVDQMRQEYLYRFAPKFGEGGFKRLINEGFMMRNAHYNYVPTVTGPGHASVYTGTTPAMHGIISNEWYDKELKKGVNCVSDDRFQAVGVQKQGGGVSPWRMEASTITDELKVFTQKQAKVVGVSLKDRGAALPAGHAADGAYWYDGGSGKFISSTYYKPGLPLWLEKFNNLNLADKFLSGTWNTVLPIAQYSESGPDDTPYESRFDGQSKPVFPYNLAELRKANGNFGMLSELPFGNDLLTELAKAALAGESLGSDNITDFLAVSFSATDGVGHTWGPNSIEIEDTYIRLDKNLEDLLLTIDKVVGKNQYILFLTADHALAEVPKQMMDMKIPAGLFSMGKLEKDLNEYLNQFFPGVKVIEKISNGQVFFDHSLFRGDPKTSGVDLLIATQLVVQYLNSIDGISEVFTKNDLRESFPSRPGMQGMVARGFHSKRSGDIAFLLNSGWTSGSTTGSTHGSAYTYDTHVPLIFFGNGIKPGISDQYHPIIDIAPTLSVLLKIKFPSAATGQPITEITEK